MENCTISISDKKQGSLAVVGHVGVGHVHSHSSFVQDDSAGFAVVASIMKKALKVNTRIKSVTGDSSTGTITVKTYEGGIGRTYSRRGLTPYEIELLNRVVDEDGIYTQTAAIKTFGRMYGQGVMETVVSLQGAIALSVLDSFYKKAPDKVYITTDKFEGLIDKMAATVVDINGIPVSLLLNINGSDGGIGPNEDNEGNTLFGQKGELMKMLGMDKVPNIIVESKACIPDMAKNIPMNTFLFRAQDEIDNLSVANALVDAAEYLDIPYILKTDSLPLVKGQLEKATKDFAEKIVSLGECLKLSDTSKDKVSYIAEIAKLISEDAGGISFMSNSLHEVVRSAGIVPGTAAIISLLVPQEYINYWKIPILDQEDVSKYLEIILLAITKIYFK
ncbi:hypothetical protein J2Z76_002894 [Sedimentibacter acidaminivorans]|uniref:Uncharacterized protein n=1 Tax=Sedimentibacter acidaminivorans TaxID=913099 RepID=A0ABS4GH52_9FIRM|nr:hypothetical protein [Sedimentibacter acidaminivorans]MBP1927022.1 hypothetical protein [Sedimentibacter acidaminivorans]